MKKIMLLILLFVGCSYSQDMFVFKVPELELTESIPSLFSQGSTYSDSIAMTVSTRTLKILSAIGSSGVTVDSIGTATDSVITLGETLYCYVTLDISQSYSGEIVFQHTGANGVDTLAIDYSVTGNYYLAVQDTLDFDTVTSITDLYLTLYNPSSQTISGISFSGYAPPFSISETFTSLGPGEEDAIKIRFSAIASGSYTDELIITHSADNSPSSVHLKGHWTIPVASEWLVSSPGGGGWFKALEIDPVSGRLYIVGDLAGLYYSDNNGESWSLSSNGVNRAFSDLTVLPGGDTVFTAGNGGVFRSVDGAETWTRVGDDAGEGGVYPTIEYSSHLTDDTKNHTFGAVEYNSANSRIIYAGTSHTHDTDEGSPDKPMIVMKSTDGGSTWTNVTNNIQTVDEDDNGNGVGDFAFDPTNEDIVYCGTVQGLFKSINGGGSWAKIANIRVKRVAVEPDEPNKVWVTETWTPNLWYSSNSGGQFTNIASNVGIYYTNDPAINPSKETYRFHEIKFSEGGDTVYVANQVKGEDIFWTDDNGQSWTAMNLSSDQSQWKTNNTLSSAIFLAVSPFDKRTIFYGHNTVWRSTDHGGSWTNIASNDDDNDGYYSGRGTEIIEYTDMAFDPNDPNKMMTASWDNVMLLSKDKGISWMQSNSISQLKVNLDNSPDDSLFRECYAVAYDPRNSGHVYAFVAYNDAWDFSHLARSTNGGLDWSWVTNNLPDGNWHDLVILNSGRFIATSWYPISGSVRDAYTSVDNGATWTRLFSGYFLQEIGVSTSQQTTLYIVGSARDDGSSYPLFKSTNGGQSFTGIMPDSLGIVNGIAINPDNPDIIFVAQGQENHNLQKYVNPGIYKSINGGTTFTRVLGGSYKESFRDVLYDVNNSDVLYACSELYGHISGTTFDKNLGGKIYQSTDGGTTWSDFSKNIAGAGSFTQLGMNEDGDLFVLTEGQGSYRINPAGIQVVPPTINSVTIDEFYATLSATVNISFSNTGQYANAFCSIGTDTLEWDVNMDVMTVNGSSASKNYTGLSSGTTYYVKTMLTNEVGSDTSDAVSFSLTTGTPTVDTLYAIEDYYITSCCFYNFEYFNFGGGTNHSVVLFGGFSNYDTIDSAKVFFTARANSTADDLLVKFAFEDTATPTATFTTRDEFLTRSANITTAVTDLDYDDNWSTGTQYSFTVTTSLSEINTSYTMSNGNLSLFQLDQGTTTGATKSAHSSEATTEAYRPILVIWGTQ